MYFACGDAGRSTGLSLRRYSLAALSFVSADRLFVAGLAALKTRASLGTRTSADAFYLVSLSLGF